MKRLDFAIVVWGKDYVETFLTLALPSFLARDNIPACAKMLPVRFTIITRPEDVGSFEGRSVLDKLRQYADLRILPLLTEDRFQSGNRYETMAYGHRVVIAESLRDGAALSILSPDCVIANGGLKYGLSKLNEGVKAVLVSGPRAELEAISAALLQKFGSTEPNVLDIPARRLVSLLCRYPHDISKILFWDREPFSAFPSAVYWSAGQDSLLAKYFHLHPIFVDLSVAAQDAVNSGTIDGSLLELAAIQPSDRYVVTDSDDMCVVELSRISHDPMGSLPVQVDDKVEYVAEWAKKFADASHCRQFVDSFFRYRGGEQVDWPEEEKKALAGLGSLPGILLSMKTENQASILSRINARLKRFFDAVVAR